MKINRHYAGLTFDTDFCSAITDVGQTINFTRFERAILQCLLGRPEQLVSRDQLLDAIYQFDANRSDRNIDYLISRLRKKIDDSKKDAKFIATEYGGGYRWIAQPGKNISVSNQKLLLLIGPVYGLNQVSNDYPVNRFIAQLHVQLDKYYGNKNLVGLIFHNEEEDSLNPNYAVELSLVEVDRKLSCFFILSNRKTAQVIDSFKHHFENQDADELTHTANALASRIYQKIWNTKLFRINEPRNIGDEPLSCSMFKAMMLLDEGPAGIKKIEQDLEQHLTLNPNNYEANLLLATCLHVQMMMGDLSSLEENNRKIETLVLQIVPYIQNDPLFLCEAAERLFLVGQTNLAEQLADRALSLGTSVARCCMSMGQIKVMQGKIAEGIKLYETAMDICKQENAFYNLLFLYKCFAHKANGDQKYLRSIIPDLLELKEDEFTRNAVLLCLFADDPEYLMPEVAQKSEAIPKDMAYRLLNMKYYNGARSFLNEKHREQILRGFVEFFSDLHGEDIVSEFVRQCVPGLFHAKENDEK